MSGSASSTRSSSRDTRGFGLPRAGSSGSAENAPMPGFGQRLRERVRGPRRHQGGPEVIAELRAAALGLEVASIRTTDGRPWRGAALAMMEIGLPNGVASFLAIA